MKKNPVNYPKEPTKGCCYVHVFRINGKPGYVGKGSRPNQRPERTVGTSSFGRCEAKAVVVRGITIGSAKESRIK